MIKRLRIALILLGLFITSLHINAQTINAEIIRPYALYSLGEDTYILYGRNHPSLHQVGTGQFANFLITVNGRDVSIARMKRSQLLSNPKPKYIDNRLYISEPSNQDNMQYALIQSAYPDKPSLLLSLPLYQEEHPSLVRLLDKQALGVAIDSSSVSNLSLGITKGDQDRHLTLAIDRKPPLADMLVSNLLAVDSRAIIPYGLNSDKVSLIDHCGYDIIEPSTSNGYLFSLDCQTVYVNPPKELALSAHVPTLAKADCPRIHELSDQLHQSLSLTSDKEGDFELAKFQSPFAEFNRLVEEDVSIEVSVRLEWDKLISEFKELNPSLSQLAWTALPLDGLLTATQRLAIREEMLEPIQTFTYSMSKGYICSGDPIEAAIELIYEPWAKRVFHADLHYFLITDGFFYDFPTHFAMLEQVKNANMIQYGFHYEDPEVSFGRYEQDLLREYASRRLDSELRMRIKEQTLSERLWHDPNYYFSNCDWFSITKCLGKLWYGNSDFETATIRDAIEFVSLQNNSLILLRYLRSELAPVEKTLTIHLHSSLADAGLLATVEPGSDQRPAPHIQHQAKTGWQHQARTYDDLDFDFNNHSVFDSSRDIHMSPGATIMPSRRSNCGSIYHPKQMRAVYFAHDCSIAFLTPAIDRVVIESSQSASNKDICDAVSGYFDFTNTALTNVLDHLASSQDTAQRQSLINGLNEIIKEKRDLSEFIKQAEAKTYKLRLVTNQDIKDYQAYNPQFTWKTLPVKGIKVNHDRTNALGYQIVQADYATEPVPSISLSLSQDFQTACRSETNDHPERFFDVLPSLSLLSDFSAKVKVDASLVYEDLLASKFLTFDMDFFFIHLRTNTLYTKNLQFDNLNITIEDNDHYLTTLQRNLIYLEASARLLEKVNERYSYLFGDLFDDDAPSLSARKPEANEDFVAAGLLKSGRDCPSKPNAIHIFSSNVAQSNCFMTHIWEGWKKILESTHLSRNINILHQYEEREQYSQEYIFESSLPVLLGSEQEDD